MAHACMHASPICSKAYAAVLLQTPAIDKRHGPQEPGTMDSVRSGPFGQIFRPDNFIFGQVRATLAALSLPPTICGWLPDAQGRISCMCRI